MGLPGRSDLRRGRRQHDGRAVLARRTLRPRLPDQLLALHLLRAVHRGLPHSRAHDDERVRAGRTDPRGPDLREAGPARAARRGDARGSAPDGAGDHGHQLLPWRRPRCSRGAGGLGARAPARRAEPRHRHDRGAGSQRCPVTQLSVLLSLPASITSAGNVSSGETALFWVLAPLMVFGALGLLFARKAVHAALGIVLVMISLAFLYTAQEAPFLGVVQVVVYTGAVMMLFVFVLMLVGVDNSDSLVETLKGQRWIGAILGLGVAAALIGVIRTATPSPRSAPIQRCPLRVSTSESELSTPTSMR